mmetsp:Transcript_49121/g.79232  ORF Transcript_49121/g.79232 Transcript_49121/m.79232 type:complete len:81 (-) Transcript_49121:431-673(-)
MEFTCHYYQTLCVHIYQCLCVCVRVGVLRVERREVGFSQQTPVDTCIQMCMFACLCVCVCVCVWSVVKVASLENPASNCT